MARPKKTVADNGNSNSSEISIGKEEDLSKVTCGIIMPISEMDGYKSGHWLDVKTILTSVTGELGISDCDVVSNSFESGLIHSRIVSNLYSKDLVICDVSGKNPNVLFELGLRLAFDKPTIILKDDVTDYMFDTSPIEHLTYPKTLHYLEIQEFKDRLKNVIINTYQASKDPKYSTFVRHFGITKVAEIKEEKITADEYIIDKLEHLNHKLNRIEFSLSDSQRNAQYKGSSRPNLGLTGSYFKSSYNQPKMITDDHMERIVKIELQRELENDPSLTLQDLASNPVIREKLCDYLLKKLSIYKSESSKKMVWDAIDNFIESKK